MSQVVRAIESVDTDTRKVLRDSFSPLFQDVFTAKSTIQELRFDEVVKEYRIGVTIGSQVLVSAAMISASTRLPVTLRCMSRR